MLLSSTKLGTIRVVVKATVGVIVWTYVASRPGRQLIDRSIIESNTLLSKLEVHVAMNESDFPVAACVASCCVWQISRLICVFYFGENLEAIWAIRRRLKRRICDANIGVLFFVWWLVIRLVTWTSGREGETQISLSYIWLIKSRSLWPRGLRPLACWDCGFESHRGMDVCFLWALCVVRKRSLRRASYSSIEVLPSVICLRVIVKPQQWRGSGQLGLSTAP
jgi:hypothetical protein